MLLRPTVEFLTSRGKAAGSRGEEAPAEALFSWSQSSTTCQQETFRFPLLQVLKSCGPCVVLCGW